MNYCQFHRHKLTVDTKNTRISNITILIKFSCFFKFPFFPIHFSNNIICYKIVIKILINKFHTNIVFPNYKRCLNGRCSFKFCGIYVFSQRSVYVVCCLQALPFKYLNDTYTNNSYVLCILITKAHIQRLSSFSSQWIIKFNKNQYIHKKSQFDAVLMLAV